MNLDITFISQTFHGIVLILDSGIACFIVYLVHFIVNWFPALRNTYGTSPTDNHFFQLPIIRVLFEGHAAVSTFFVISGYAISYRALSKIHTGDTLGVLETLSSSTFRRCMRLYLPCAVNTFICMLLRYWDFFTPDPLRWNTVPPQLPTFPAQFWDWWANQKIFMYPFLNVEGGVYSPPYNGHLWTIPLEIRGSFVVYGTVLAVAKLSSGWRMAFLVCWDAYLFYMGKWDLFLFVGGALLANLDIPRHAKAKAMADKVDQQAGDEREEKGLLPTSETMEKMTIEVLTASHKSPSAWIKLTRRTKPYTVHICSLTSLILRILRKPVPYMLFPLSLFLLSFPHIPASLDTEWVYGLIPNSFNNLGSFLGGKAQGVRVIGSLLLAFTLSLSSSPPKSPPGIAFHLNPAPPVTVWRGLLSAMRRCSLQALFTNRFAQYLGKISFGFYLMHGPVLFCIGTKILRRAWTGYEVTGTGKGEGDVDEHERMRTYVGWFMLAVVVNTTAIFWAADWFARVVDERSVRWAATVARFVSRKKVVEK